MKDFERIDTLSLEITKIWNVMIPIMKDYRDSLNDALELLAIMVEREDEILKLPAHKKKRKKKK